MITVYTDGGCYNNPPNKGTGAFAYVIPTTDSMVKIVGGRINNTTSNRAEMMAILQAIEDLCIHKQLSLNIYTDSGYCYNGIMKYLDMWIANGYTTTTNKPVKNQDLWNMFSMIRWHTQFKLNLIRGHNKDRSVEHAYWNNICDHACTYLIREVSKCGIYQMSYWREQCEGKKKIVFKDLILLGDLTWQDTNVQIAE